MTLTTQSGELSGDYQPGPNSRIDMEELLIITKELGIIGANAAVQHGVSLADMDEPFPGVDSSEDDERIKRIAQTIHDIVKESATPLRFDDVCREALKRLDEEPEEMNFGILRGIITGDFKLTADDYIVLADLA